MSNRERRGSYDYWGCVADYDHETADEARKRRHETQECDGVPHCDYCVQEIINEQTEGESNENQ